MALTQGTDTYITETSADTYIADMPGDYPTVWAALTSAQKQKFLKRAARYLDNHYRDRWIGDLYNSTQSLAWPRYGNDNTGRVIDGLYPNGLQYAQAEIAARMANSEEPNQDLDRGGQVNAETVGPISTTYDPSAPVGTVFTEVDDLLWPLLVNRGATMQLRRV